MYYRNPDHIDPVRLNKAIRTARLSKPPSLASRLFMSVGMIVAPVVAFFLILGVDRLIAAL